MGPAPGMDIPGQSPGPGRGFQPPPNMPGINFNAPVIRLGVGNEPSRADNRGGRRDTGGGSNAEPLGNRNRLGLGADRGGPGQDDQRRQMREAMVALAPPTREEVARTIFVGGLGEGTPGDESIEAILQCAGGLRRWTRAMDAEGKACKFGFAEYEDSDSLEAASEILRDVEVPLMKSGVPVKDEEGKLKKVKLLVVVDEASQSYIKEWKGRKNEDPNAREFRLETCRDELTQCLAAISNASAHMANGGTVMENGDVNMADATNGEANADGAEVINIPLQVEDELSDIPAEMRAIVAEEIKSFRDRSTRRDLERLRREEEMEAQERARSRPSRLASPPLAAPSGPAGGANGIPVGPRGSRIEGAPSGPKGYRGAQMPSDYANGVPFVDSNGVANSISISREDEDDPASDEELERRRKEKRDAELEKHFLDAERRWLNRERTRTAALEREKAREEQEEAELVRQKENMRRRLEAWDDDEEAKKETEEYYVDRSLWLRRRQDFRLKEMADDDRDRQAEEREKAAERQQHDAARGMADDFLGGMAEDLEKKAAEQPSGFKMSLGTATRRAPETKKKPAADVEGLLEDEEDAAAEGRRLNLKPLSDLSTAPSGIDMSDEERAAAQTQLAHEIPTSMDELFAYPIKWDHLSDDLVEKQIQPFVTKKVIEYLGVQEDMLVEVVTDYIQKRGKAQELVEELSSALEEEAEVLVKKVWRLLVFWSECEARGYGS